VICALVSRIRRALPESASIGRVGGEEFTILLPEARIEDAMIIASYIHSSLNASPLDVLPQQLVTASFGVSLGMKNSDFENLYSAADAALYTAKKRGRNQVALHEIFSPCPRSRRTSHSSVRVAGHPDMPVVSRVIR
jgi:diguanylate cyclase (GGDEF)-like protein